MSKHLLYLVGEPGVGKSTLANYLTRDLDVVQVGGPGYEVAGPGWHSVPHMRYYGPGKSRRGKVEDCCAIQLGCLHDSGFHGADRLRRDVMPFLLRWIAGYYSDEIPIPVVKSVFDSKTFKGDGYPGAEALSMMNYPPHHLMIAEGDRLAHEAFFDWMWQLEYNINIVFLVGEDVAQARRLARGTNQDETWVKGRRTLAQRLCMLHNGEVVEAGSPLDVQAAKLMRNPVVHSLMMARGYL